MRKNMDNKKILMLSALLIINCSGTIPAVGNEVAVQEMPDRGEEVVKEEVSVETFTIQEPESPPLPITVFEPYMIKRGDYLIKIAAREYGDSSMWREIYEWNKQEIGPDPDRIYPYNFLSLKRDAEQAKNCDLEFFEYTIQSGDTAWSLAERVYSDELAWVVIYMDNADIIKNNNGVLQPGATFQMRRKLDPCN
jgi:nucleoid-associated protein YgaU